MMTAEARTAVVGLLLIHFLLCLHTAFEKNVTHDEIWHLPVGLRNLRDRDPGVEHLNPPLTRMWAALPLWLGGATLDSGCDGMDCGNDFVVSNPDSFVRWYRWGRLFNIFWSLATAMLVFLLARHLFGPLVGMLALLLFVTSPNVIAYASIVTPESGLMCGFVATLCAFWWWLDRPGWGRAVLLGIVLGLTEATKFTAIILYPLLVAIFLVQRARLWFSRVPGDPEGLSHEAVHGRKLFAQGTGAVVISLGVLAAAYQFQGLFRPLGSFAFLSPELQTLQQLLSFAPGLPVPLPADYLQGLDEQRSIMKAAHPVFLDGVWSVTGFREYYLKTLLYKLPHFLQLLLGLSLVLVVLGRCGPPRRHQDLSLLLPVVVLVGIASLETMQLGMRYILPVLPLLLIFAARCAGGVSLTSKRAGRWTFAAVLLLCGFSLRHHPHHLAYFNELVGGPTGGRNHLLDSNLDWGQDLVLVQQYMQQQGWDTIRLSYFGTLDPEALGIDFSLPPSWRPEPGQYAVSVNYVMGRPHVVIEPGGTKRSVDFQEWGYFRQFEPTATLGGSIDIYELGSDQPASSGQSR